MKTKIIVASAIIGLAAIGAQIYAGEEESENKKKIEISELPAAVQKTIQDNLGGGTVTETVKETEGGRTYYDAEVRKAGGEQVEIKVAEDGSLIGIGKEEEDNN